MSYNFSGVYILDLTTYYNDLVLWAKMLPEDFLLCFAGLRSRTILILGDSIAFWAGRFATLKGEPAMGLHAAVEWRGRRGLHLGEVPGFLETIIRKEGYINPSHVIMHVGTNDIGRFSKVRLMQLVAKTMAKVQLLLPEARVIWSEILPRRSYTGFLEKDQMRADRVRLAMNKRARAWCRRAEVPTMARQSIRHEDQALFRPDGIHLSDVGIELFLRDVARGIVNILWVTRGRLFHHQTCQQACNGCHRLLINCIQDCE